MSTGIQRNRTAIHTSATFLFLPPKPTMINKVSVHDNSHILVVALQLVMRSATPADSCKNVSALTSSKNSRQNCFISSKPIRMIAALHAGDQHNVQFSSRWRKNGISYLLCCLPILGRQRTQRRQLRCLEEQMKCKI
jgi:hypothetical protein